ncbi:hypothetical protein K439DRAFT_1618544 [Ramaria rubella]|nr:hypothetical protein K439DRAFT_1618544 [Ramaria rubella]
MDKWQIQVWTLDLTGKPVHCLIFTLISPTGMTRCSRDFFSHVQTALLQAQDPGIVMLVGLCLRPLQAVATGQDRAGKGSVAAFCFKARQVHKFLFECSGTDATFGSEPFPLHLLQHDLGHYMSTDVHRVPQGLGLQWHHPRSATIVATRCMPAHFQASTYHGSGALANERRLGTEQSPAVGPNPASYLTSSPPPYVSGLASNDIVPDSRAEGFVMTTPAQATAVKALLTAKHIFPTMCGPGQLQVTSCGNTGLRA